MKNRTIILGLSIGLLLIMATCFPSYSGNLPIISFPPSITNITICNNQLPYHWNNITCLTAGTYTAVLTGSNGLDSTAILNLSVINIGSSITNAVICDNQLPYTWNGHSYTGSGTYSVTLTSSTGCDSVPILSLTVNHVVTSNTSVNICSNQLPYAWNGNSYNAAGNYNVTLTSIAGCDSVAILHLLVRSISTSTTTKTVCGNQLPYHWNGNSYAAAGNYQVTLTGSNGCDSIAKLQLSVIPVSTSFTSVSVCSNQLPYSWNGQSYTTPGNHSVNFISASGCDSIATLVLTIKPIAQSNTTIRICDGQLPYTWNGNSYTSAGYYSVTLTNAGCDSIANLHLVAVPVLTSNNPVTVCNSQLPYNWNGIDYNTAGTYTASFVNGSGCDSVATLVLSIDTPQLVNGDVVLCEGQLPYTWNGYVFTAEGTYPIDPPIFVDACHSISSFTVSVDSFHIYDVTSVCNNQLPFNWHNHTYNSAGIFNVVLPSTTGGCDTLATLVLSVNQVATSITNMNVCNTQLPFSWNGHNYNSGGTYSVNLVSSHGCDSMATLNLHVNSVQASTSNLVICNGQLPYNWNGHTYSASGIYTVTLTSIAGCDSIATLNLGVQPFLTSTTNLTVCNNQLPYNWNGNNYSLAGTYTATLTSSGGCDSIATLNLVINNLLQGDTTINICNTQLPFNWNGNVYSNSGNYSVSLISSGGCDSVATLHLVVNGVAYSNTTVTVCNNQLPYSWNGNSYPVAGMYPVTLTSSGGCDSIATLNLIVTDILTSTTNVTICNAQLPFT